MCARERYSPGDLCYIVSEATGEVLIHHGPVMVIEESIGYANAPGYSHQPDYIYTIFWQGEIHARVSASWLVKVDSDV